MDFPVYRKYTNNRSFFIITSEKTWIEYKFNGKKFEKHSFTANQFPEMMFIKDLIQPIQGVESSSESEVKNLLV